MTVAAVVLADVEASRELEDRAAFGRRLDDALAEANARREALVGAFERQAGLDEFAGVLRPGRLADVLVLLWERLHPVGVRFAVGQGELDVVPEPPEGEPLPGASGFDGPGFHRADRLLEELRSGPRRVAVRLGAAGPPGAAADDAGAREDARAERQDRLLSTTADLLYARILGWTDRQMEVHRAYREAGSQAAAAERLDVDQSTVSRVLSAADQRRVALGLETFAACLDDASREAVP